MQDQAEFGSDIDWDAAADSLKMDFTEYNIGTYTYYGRAS